MSAVEANTPPGPSPIFNLPTAINYDDIPVVSQRLMKNAPVEIGTVENASANDCKLKLLGAEEIQANGWNLQLSDASGKATVTIHKPHGSDLEKRPGEVLKILKARNTISIARASIDHSAKIEAAGKLSNCMLQISCFDAHHFVALRKPVILEQGFAISFKEPSSSISIKLTNWPNNGIYLQVPDKAQRRGSSTRLQSYRPRH